MNEFFLKFKSNLKNLQIAETLWKYFLSNQGLSEEKEYWLNLSIHEIVLNAIVHGNKNDERKWVFLSAKRMKNFLKIEITDEGICKKIPKIENPGRKNNIFKNHGRGLYIVKKSVDNLKFKILPKGNLKVILKSKVFQK
jgi:serine/threonine-protein kinase RsbW